MIEFRRQPYADGPDMEATLGYALQQRDVMSLGELSHYVAADGPTVRRNLVGLVIRGDVEELRPVSSQEDERHVFFRWRRPEDGAYLVQQEFSEGRRHKGRPLWWYDGKLIQET